MTQRIIMLLVSATGGVAPLAILSDTATQLKEIQDLVGGYVEAYRVPVEAFPDTHITMLVNDDGKALGLSPNVAATRLMRPGAWLTHDQVIVGEAILTVLDEATGDHTSMPPEVARWLTQAAG